MKIWQIEVYLIVYQLFKPGYFQIKFNQYSQYCEMAKIPILVNSRTCAHTSPPISLNDILLPLPHVIQHTCFSPQQRFLSGVC